jgi:hypothetical protein
MRVPPSSSDAFNIVFVGAWNPAIFSPEWAKANLALDTEHEVVLAIPMQLALPPRLTVDDVNIYPGPNSLMLDCVTYNDASADACVAKFHRLAELLPHTPVTAMGINFRFWGEMAENAALAELFAFADAAHIDAGTYGLIEASIMRSYSLEDGTKLNLKINSLLEQVRIEFNFHSDVRSLGEAAERISEQKLRDFRQQAIALLDAVYKVALDD